MPIVSTLQGILLSVLPVFTQPSGQVFLRLVVGWVLCPTRRTVTGIIPYADPDGLRSHDTYHRFFRAAAWCRDAVRSTRQRTVHVWGLKIVPLCLRVRPPWGGEPLALPIAFRLYRKGGPTLLDLVEEMVNDVAAWFPDRTFTLAADGFYAPLAGRPLPRTHVISRMRRDAALYKMPPARRKGQRGRPRKKGGRGCRRPRRWLPAFASGSWSRPSNAARPERVSFTPVWFSGITSSRTDPCSSSSRAIQAAKRRTISSSPPTSTCTRRP